MSHYTLMMVRWSLAPPDCIFQQHTRCARCMFPWKTVFDQSGGKTLWAFQFHFIHFLRALQALITVLQICSFTRQELVSDQAICLLGSSPLGKKNGNMWEFFPSPILTPISRTVLLEPLLVYSFHEESSNDQLHVTCLSRVGCPEQS